MNSAALQIVEVTLDRPYNSGPDAVVILATTAPGKSVDFLVELPRGEGEQYIKDLGVSSYLHVEHVLQPVGQRPRLRAIKERRSTATGKKVDEPASPAPDEVH